MHRPSVRILVLFTALALMGALLSQTTTSGAEPAGAAAGSPRRGAALLDAGDDHTCAILSTGSVKCWGANTSGDLGLGDTTNRGGSAGQMGDNLPTIDLGTGRTARAIVPGAAHSCALLDDRTVKCWGWNNNGQLGQGNILQLGDEAGEMGNSLPVIDLGTGRTAVTITAGDEHT